MTHSLRIASGPSSPARMEAWRQQGLPHPLATQEDSPEQSSAPAWKGWPNTFRPQEALTSPVEVLGSIATATTPPQETSTSVSKGEPISVYLSRLHSWERVEAHITKDPLSEADTLITHLREGTDVATLRAAQRVVAYLVTYATVDTARQFTLATSFNTQVIEHNRATTKHPIPLVTVPELPMEVRTQLPIDDLAPVR